MRLAEDTIAAVCLTETGDELLVNELCTVDLSGEREFLGIEVDAGEAIALSPDRTTIAAVIHGELNTVRVDGRHLENSTVLGSSPEWIDDRTVGLVTTEGVVAIDVESHGTTVLADIGLIISPFESVVESFSMTKGGRLFATLYADRGPTGPDNSDLFALAAIDLDAGTSSLLVGPTGSVIAHPDWSPDGRLAIIMDTKLYLVDETTGETAVASPVEHVATTPTWSADGTRIAWLANGVGSPVGPAVLVYANAHEMPFRPLPIIGNRDEPLDGLPAFPEW